MLLTEEEAKTIESMSHYWEEVRKREDRSPLSFELKEVHRMIGTGRILAIMAEYAKNQLAGKPE